MQHKRGLYFYKTFITDEVLIFKFIYALQGMENCSPQAVAFHPVVNYKLKMFEYLVYNFTHL